MTDPVYAIAANRPEELDALLTFLQNDGSIANIRYPGSIFDDMFFLTPQWLFHSLLVSGIPPPPNIPAPPISLPPHIPAPPNIPAPHKLIFFIYKYKI